MFCLVYNMSEKITDHLLLSEWESVFNCPYNTETNKKLFGRLIPDGWFEYSNNKRKYLFIIENKKKDKLKGISQLKKYFDVACNYSNNYTNIFLISGVGDNKSNFKYQIYVAKNNKITNYDYSLSYIKKQMDYSCDFDESSIHDFNQYMWDNGINLPKSQKTLFVASILLALSIDPDLIKDYDPDKPGFILANKIIELINDKYSDITFTNQFNFLKKSLNNKYLYDLIKKINIDLKKYEKDILNIFYSEFCKYDKNNDSQLGVVLTPHDIVKLMIDNLDIKQDDSVLDFCTGTGSFLLEASKHTNHLIGCENNEERYALLKCNFILNNLDYSKLYYNSCFSINFDKVDKSIINPPFSTNSSDLNLVENETKWQNYNNEQKFLLYQVQCLKIGGLGACIIPRSNFNNTIKKTTEFKAELMKNIRIIKIINCNSKVFAPIASVECAIIIYQKLEYSNIPYYSENVEIIDYSNDGFDIRKNIRIKISEPIINTQIRTLKYNDDWNFQKEYTEPDDLLKMIKLYNVEYSATIQKRQIINSDNVTLSEIKKYDVLLSDLFEILKVKTYLTDKSENGDIPLYGATKLNNPVKFINQYSIDTYNSDDLSIKLFGVFCINKTGDGGAGISFIKKGKFAINPTILCCKMKIPISLSNAAYISFQLHNIFNRANSLNITKFNTIKVRINDNDIKLYDDFKLKQHIIEEFKVKEWELMKIGDYFDKITPIKIFQISKTENGNIPLISSSGLNNGISKYISDYSYDGECLSIARNGTVGSSFYQNGKIGITTDIILLKKKENNTINYHIWALMINYYLTQKYNYSHKLTIEKLMNEQVNIPIFE